MDGSLHSEQAKATRVAGIEGTQWRRRGSWERSRTEFLRPTSRAAVRRWATTFPVLALCCVVAASTLAACSSSTGATKTLMPAPGVSVVVPSSSSLTVSAVPASTAVLTSVRAPIQVNGTSAPSPLQSLSSPVRLKAHGALPAGGATLKVRIPASKGKGAAPFLASYNPKTQTWTPVATTYDSATHQVSAVVPHFSIWDVFRFTFGGVADVVKGVLAPFTDAIRISTPAPTCDAAPDLTTTVKPVDGIVQVCAEDANAQQIVIKVSNTLAFPIDVKLPPGVQTTLTPPDDAMGWIDQALATLTQGKYEVKEVPAGSEIAVTIATGAGQLSRFQTSLDTVAYLMGILGTAVTELTLMLHVEGGNPATIASSIEQGKCASNITAVLHDPPRLTADEISRVTTVAFECAEQVEDLGAAGVVAGLVALAASLTENVMQTVLLGVESAVGWSTGGVYEITVKRSAAVPVLGAVSAFVTTGFGSVAPPVVQYGGDGYSQVSGITWKGWGSAQATGTGTGWYVPSGESRGQGSSQPATVVAYDLGTCGSGPAYTKFSYYFPGQGENFSPDFYLNACTGGWNYPTAAPTTITTAPAATAAHCDGSDLAAAAHTWATQQQNYQAGTSALNAFACDGAYAGAVASTTTGGGSGFRITFHYSGGVWTVLAASNILPPDNLPSDVYSQLHSDLQTAPQDENFPF